MTIQKDLLSNQISLPNLSESVLKDEQTMPLVVSSESEPGYGDAPCDSIGDSGIKESLDTFTRKNMKYRSDIWLIFHNMYPNL